MFVCPRCNYETKWKNTMGRHLDRVRLCPDKNNMILDDEIKKIILKNHVYHQPSETVEKERSVSQIVQNYNLLNKMITDMDFQEKLGYMDQYHNKRIMDIDRNLENHFEGKIKRLEDKSFNTGYFLEEPDFIKIINNLTKIDRNNLDKLSVFYQKTIKRINLFDGSAWESYIEDDGVKELVSLIKSYFFDTYELYLIKNLHRETGTPLNRFQLNTCIEIYYSFIAVFGLRPIVSDYSDREILDHALDENNPNHLAKFYLEKFTNIKDNIKVSDSNKLKRKIINVIRENTVHNVNELDHVLFEILKVNDRFRDQIIESKHI